MWLQLKHWKAREWRFLGLTGLNLVAIALYLGAGLGQLEPTGTTWRRVDIDALRQRMDSGELSGREAQWYHPTRPGERAGPTSQR
jgi:hypothetical protein